jgi:hypothetical protein
VWAFLPEGHIMTEKPKGQGLSSKADHLLHAGLGLLVQLRGMEADGFLRAALKLGADPVLVLNSLGVNQVVSGKPERGMEMFQTALRFDPDHLPTRQNLAVAKMYANASQTNHELTLPPNVCLVGRIARLTWEF